MRREPSIIIITYYIALFNYQFGTAGKRRVPNADRRSVARLRGTGPAEPEGIHHVILGKRFRVAVPGPAAGAELLPRNGTRHSHHSRPYSLPARRRSVSLSASPLKRNYTFKT